MPFSGNENQLQYIGQRIRHVRKSKGMTQEKLAQSVKVDVKTIKRLEAGKHNSGVTLLLAIGEALQEDIYRLLPSTSFQNEGPLKRNKAIAWWSGGITSAVACKWAVDTFRNVEVVFIDTHNEDIDTYRFLEDCEKWYGCPIKRITNEKYGSIEEVWDKYMSLNNAYGAICSSELKRTVRVDYQDLSLHYTQVFGFELSERKRHRNMKLNFPEINSIAPLIDLELEKKDCIKIVKDAGIEVPRMYQLGYKNNNCWGTGCVRGGIGYWQKLQREEPEKFNEMAEREHRYSVARNKAVTVLRVTVNGERHPCFLKPMSGYEYHIGMAKGREPKSLVECTGFCNTKDEEEEEL